MLEKSMCISGGISTARAGTPATARAAKAAIAMDRRFRRAVRLRERMGFGTGTGRHPYPVRHSVTPPSLFNARLHFVFPVFSPDAASAAVVIEAQIRLGRLQQPRPTTPPLG